MNEKLKEKLAEFENKLKDREKVIFKDRLIAEEPKTLQELGERFGVSRERVRQVESRLKVKLAKFLEANLPDAVPGVSET
jgi:RNA polymerase sigma-32 factor